MATTCSATELEGMKTKQIISLIAAITSVALSPVAWAGPHGGGGGGFGGGFHGGGARGGGGGFRSAGFGGGQFGGGGFGAPHMSFGGAVNRGGGIGFGVPRSSGGLPHIATGPTHDHSFVPSRSPVVHSPGSNPTRGLTNVGRGNRGGTTSGRATVALNRPNNRGTNSSTARPSQTSSHRGLNGRTDHIAERHDTNWHSDWDRRHAHFDHGRFFVFNNGFWFGLDDGFFPWDYLPYYTDDYYPYDYYADVDPNDYSGSTYDLGSADSATVQAVQRQLLNLGYYNGSIDGVFGPSTRDAVAKYQIANHLNVTGSLSPDTIQSLGVIQPTAS